MRLLKALWTKEKRLFLSLPKHRAPQRLLALPSSTSFQSREINPNAISRASFFSAFCTFRDGTSLLGPSIKASRHRRKERLSDGFANHAARVETKGRPLPGRFKAAVKGIFADLSSLIIAIENLRVGKSTK